MSRLLALLGLASFGAAGFVVTKPKLPNSHYIVEFDAPSHGLTKRDHADLHARFISELDQRAPDEFNVRKRFASDIFSGVSLSVARSEHADTIATIPGVRAVYPVRQYPAPPIAKRGVAPPLPESPPGHYAPIIMTGVDQLHAQGTTGKGIKIGIIDTGIDFMHPALGGGFGPGFKVAGGYDFVGDDWTPGGKPVPDEDPTDCAGHGTMVASVIGADPNNPYNVTGVAYDASLYAYRVFGCDKGTDDEVQILALQRAYEDGMDVINISIGGPSGWSQTATGSAVSQVKAKGVIVVIAAGNEGQSGSWFASTPAGSDDAIAVGSVQNIELGPVFSATTSIKSLEQLPYMRSGNETSTSLEVADGPMPVFTMLAAPGTKSACSPLPETVPDLSKFVTLVQQGGCTVDVKMENLVAKGAGIVLMYAFTDSFSASPTEKDYPQLAFIRLSDARTLSDAYWAGANVTLSFPASVPAVIPNTPTVAGLTSVYTTYGPTFDMQFKPQLSAPGGDILMAAMQSKGSYETASGTSFASPHTAGIAALILQAKGKAITTGMQMRDLMQTTSGSIPATSEPGIIGQTLAAVGSGLVNAYAAITYTTIVSPGQLLCNDTANWIKEHSFEITNTGTAPRTYLLKHVPAGTMISRSANMSLLLPGPVPIANDGFAEVHIAVRSLTLLPGQSQPVSLFITPPAGVKPALIPVVSGHIEIESDPDEAGNVERLHVAYLGAAAALKDVKVLDTSSEFDGKPFPRIIDGEGKIQTGPANYTFVGKDFPTLQVRLAFGSPLVTVDFLFGEDGKPLPGMTQTQTYAPRMDAITLPTFDFPLGGIEEAGGQQPPRGLYKIAVRALHVTGDPTKAEDYDNWLSPPFTYV